jgi:hypothetical protein
MKYTSPLNIYVVWHPSFDEGRKYFQFLYSALCRDVKQPLSRGIGIPVFERSVAASNSFLPLAVPFDEADRTAIVALIDDEMFNDTAWTTYLEALIPMSEDVRLYPVALSKHAHKISRKISEIQFINLWTKRESPIEISAQELIVRLLHELSRQLLNLNASHADNNLSTPPVSLFISHAKWDGETIAKDFRNYIRSETKLASFFDANDIPDGSTFSKQIERKLRDNAVIVVFQTDAYASREWCRREVILAKRYKIPIIVVNALEHVERRSFPYLGNVPVMRWKHDFDFIIAQALSQVLYQVYTELVLQRHIALYLPGRADVEYIATSPELFNYIDIVRLQKEKALKKIIVMYPDPPLGLEELQLLNEIDEDVVFVTPISLSPKMKTL